MEGSVISDLAAHIKNLTDAFTRLEDTVQLRLLEISSCFLKVQQDMLEAATCSSQELYLRAVEHFSRLATHKKELRESVQPMRGDLTDYLTELDQKEIGRN